jgi:uncharacterized protein YuzE
VSGPEFYVKVVVDMEADAAYIELADSVGEGEASVNEDFALKKRKSMVVFDLNEGGELLGIEIVGISGLFKNSDFQSSVNIDSES